MAIEVWTAADLDNVRNNLSGDYIQMADIDLSGYANWNPIGGTNSPQAFTGSMDFNNFKVTNFVINRPTESYIGLFSWLKGATILQPNINGNISGKANVGMLAGMIDDSTYIENGFTDGSVIGASHYTNTGGFIGVVYPPATIIKSISMATVSGYDNVGGFVGRIYGSTVYSDFSQCVAEGDVTGHNNVGGFAGQCYIGRFTDAYAQGSVNGSDYCGGFCGGNYNIANFENVYAVGLVTSVNPSLTYSGGLIGYNYGTGNIVSSYYDTNTTGKTDTTKGTPKTTVEMKQQNTFSGWDFSDIWVIDEGVTYPTLKFLVPPVPPVTPTITPSGGTFTGSVTVTIGNIDEGCTAYYATDGTTPTTESTAYAEPFELSVSATVKAATHDAVNDLWSEVASATFTKNAEPDPGGTNPNVPALITKELKTLSFKRASITDTKQAADATNDNFRQVSSYTGAVTKTLKQYNENFAGITKYQTDMQTYIANLETLLISAGIMPAPE